MTSFQLVPHVFFLLPVGATIMRLKLVGSIDFGIGLIANWISFCYLSLPVGDRLE